MSRECSDCETFSGNRESEEEFFEELEYSLRKTVPREQDVAIL